MLRRKSVRLGKTLVLLASASLALAACADGGSGTTDSSGAAGTAFPKEQFPDSTYAGLDGKVAWYDSSGGATTKAREDTIFRDFQDLTGVSLASDFNADSSKFFAAAEAGQVPWSFVEFATLGDFMKARDAGYLEKLDTAKVDLSKLEDGAYDDYGIHTMRYGIVLTYNTDKWSADGEHPDSLTDLYDTQKFPGKRCLFQYPQYGATLESALLADGVARDDLYPLDVPRALAKLDAIKDDIVWWSDGDEAIRLLTTGECDLGVAWSGRVYNAVTKDDAPLAISWNESLYTDAVYAVPKGAPNADAGQSLVAMILDDTQGQVEQVKAIPYPTALKALSDSDYPSDLQPWLPVGANADAAIAEDETFYATQIDKVAKQFDAWVSK